MQLNYTNFAGEVIVYGVQEEGEDISIKLPTHTSSLVLSGHCRSTGFHGSKFSTDGPPSSIKHIYLRNGSDLHGKVDFSHLDYLHTFDAEIEPSYGNVVDYTTTAITAAGGNSEAVIEEEAIHDLFFSLDKRTASTNC